MSSACFGKRRASLAAPVAAVIFAAFAAPSGAQTSSSFTACSQGSLQNCSVISLTSELGVGFGGTNLFEIAVRNLGSQTTPSLATTIYNLVFSTGQAPASSGSEIDVSLTPATRGGATISDASEWDLFDSGDAIFLSALGGNGVGNCVVGAGVGGFSQAGRTCDNDTQFLAFSFFTTRAYDPRAFSLLDLEVVGLTGQLPADSCNETAPCVITAAPVTATPEPGTLLLSLAGFSGIAGIGLHKRSVHNRSGASRTRDA